MWPSRAVPSSVGPETLRNGGFWEGLAPPLAPPSTYLPILQHSPPLPIPIAVTQGGAPRLYAQGSKNAHLPLEVRLARASMRCAALPLARLALGPQPAWPRRALRSRAACVYPQLLPGQPRAPETSQPMRTDTQPLSSSTSSAGPVQTARVPSAFPRRVPQPQTPTRAL